MISEEEIRKIAKLSYLKINDNEIEEMRDKFSSILDYINKLQELNLDNIAETANLSKTDNVFREDVSEKKDSEGLINAFSKKKDRFLEVKKILYNED
ncbi:MAG: Asp-tRNA(Asn)/Glu-tRNA(Gln) amidotransferase subunit GatC [Candidatus Pacebacteria bacterium]|nr:Asp-tRNA(Asn)/Glu-tRNA(Gln) amidotransferase subunit GatC [Candidatus Paceibacterota bacterium]